ncbi:hypothetical protein Nham_2707 [Nitrobacter hamburgensis X14]|uniref:Transmembrane protein n=1 Tax=Nitrobacter hamburgensis (strain DSM 10229 / NCIMB 13809 / X14) TaxID=323097 RepID=Q1QJW1_NITHX|nr:hypothetical protein Nham_2707 [Nitrobacter hamburgensis X14]
MTPANQNGLDICCLYVLILAMSNWSAYRRSKPTIYHAETKVTPKQTATVASLSVFGVGLVAITILARTFKDEFSDFTIAAIATLMFVAFYVLGQWVKRAIDPPPTVKK